jgi:predicted glycosyltransferase
MKIWFDMSNSPHVNFFAYMIRELEKEHEIIITCRPLANTIELLDLHGFKYHVIGSHYGANKILKVYGFIQRVFQLYFFLKKIRPDVAISHSTFNSPLVAKMLGVRSVYLNDNEHALGNIPAFRFASTIMIPEYLSRERIIKQGAKDYKLISYPGVKEGVYLWTLDCIKSGNTVSENQRDEVIYIRPEPWAAQYYSGAKNFLDPLIMELKKQYKVVILPRGEIQAKHYRDKVFQGVEIPDRALGIEEIYRNCLLFIGAGGTMTRELAVMGVPTISVYQDELLDVDKHLIKAGYLIHKPDLDADYVYQYLRNIKKQSAAGELLLKGKEAYGLIKSTLVHGAHNGEKV